MPGNEGFVVTPLCVGRIGVYKAELTYNVDFSVRLHAPVFVYALRKNGPSHILVDAGFQPRLRNSSAQGGLTQFKRALKRARIDENQIEIVILTHLHSDHCSFLHLFKRAKVFLQAAELSHSHDPLPTQRFFYNDDTLKRLEKMDVEVLRGDKRIENGLRVIHTPGHTPGSQTVLAGTADGTFAICGDTVPMYHNWYPSNEKFGTPVALTRIPPGVHTSLEAWFESARRIESLAETIIPSHDPKLHDRKPLPR